MEINEQLFFLQTSIFVLKDFLGLWRGIVK